MYMRGYRSHVLMRYFVEPRRKSKKEAKDHMSESDFVLLLYNPAWGSVFFLVLVLRLLGQGAEGFLIGLPPFIHVILVVVI